jgi:hypothetical protein
VTRFPIAADYLREGRVSLTAFLELGKILTDETHESILEHACGMTMEDAARFVLGLRQVDIAPREPPSSNDVSFTDENAEPMFEGAPHAPAAPSDGAAYATPVPTIITGPKIRPRLHMDMTDEFVADLRLATDLLSHKIRSGAVEEVIHEAIRRLNKEFLRKRRGSGRGQKPKEGVAVGREIPLAVKEAVWDRDQGRCAFVGENGRRCGSRKRVEFHHIVPYGKGGPPTVDNLALRCRRHNTYHAELDYGREYIERKIKEERERRQAMKQGAVPEVPQQERPPDTIDEAGNASQPRATTDPRESDRAIEASEAATPGEPGDPAPPPR